jgi:hypothetical protein
VSETILTLETFQPHLGSVFAIPLAQGRFELTLVEVSPLPSRAPDAQREPFTLLFRGPSTPVLPQRIYPLEHQTLGRQEIFIVPIGSDGAGMRYEAVFN